MIERMTDRAREPGAVSAGQTAAVTSTGLHLGCSQCLPSPGKTLHCAVDHFLAEPQKLPELQRLHLWGRDNNLAPHGSSGKSTWSTAAKVSYHVWYALLKNTGK